MTVEEFLAVLFTMPPALAQYYGGKSGCQWQEDNVRAHFESAPVAGSDPLQPTTTPISAENRNG